MSTILAIDLGKFNSVFCWYEPDSRSSTFRSVATTFHDVAMIPKRTHDSWLVGCGVGIKKNREAKPHDNQLRLQD